MTRPLLYTPGEIRQIYRLAKNPRKQVRILADLCSCPVGVIREIVSPVKREEQSMPEITQKNTPNVHDAIRLPEQGEPEEKVSEDLGYKSVRGMKIAIGNAKRIRKPKRIEAAIVSEPAQAQDTSSQPEPVKKSIPPPIVGTLLERAAESYGDEVRRYLGDPFVEAAEKLKLITMIERCCGEESEG